MDGATQQYDKDTPDEERECESCGVTQEDYGFEFETVSGETLCEQCAEEKLIRLEKGEVL